MRPGDGEGGVEGMAERSERATGTPNTIYDLASVLYHSLQAGASYEQYIRDAEEASDQEFIALRTPAAAARAETSEAPPRGQEEDRGLVDEVRDRLLGPREERRS